MGLGMKRPSFQFYPGDWLHDAALRVVSVGARGAWIDMLCLMHQSTPYGYLRVNQKVILPVNLALILGATLKEVEGWLKELEDAGAFSRTPDGCIYSRRMVRDEETRQQRALDGAKGGNPALTVKARDKGEVNHRDKGEVNANTPPSSSSSKDIPPPTPPTGGRLRNPSRLTQGQMHAMVGRPSPLPMPPAAPPPPPATEEERDADILKAFESMADTDEQRKERLARQLREQYTQAGGVNVGLTVAARLEETMQRVERARAREAARYATG